MRVVEIARPSTAPSAEAEVARVMTICNACRYCEGFCAVFPAMERRLDFARGDIHFLANLCHDCGACLHACQYAPPHDFGVNVPRAFASVRTETYETHAWPQAFGAAYRRQGMLVAAALVLGFAAVLLAALPGTLAGVKNVSFYAVIPHGTMVAIFGLAAAWILAAFAFGVVRFWRGLPHAPDPVALAPAAMEAAGEALALRYLDGGGEGCNVESDRFTHARRWFHHLAFYGFAACFAATCVATAYHYALRWPAPYPIASLPVALGIAGGVALLAGTVGLAWLARRKHPLQRHAGNLPMDAAFIGLLFATSLSGLVLLALRDSGAMPSLLAFHLAIVLALFVTLPYGKFAHAVYRVAALAKNAIERRQPRRIELPPD